MRKYLTQEISKTGNNAEVLPPIFTKLFPEKECDFEPVPQTLPDVKNRL